jgi:gamma-D-glutamyl-L-lysine dipeptidyl-peptidase
MRLKMSRAVLVLAVCACPIYGDDVPATTATAARPPSLLERLARNIEPDLVGRPERLPQYVHYFRNEIGNDFRLFAFDVSAVASLPAAGSNEAGPYRVYLRGHIEFPETRKSLKQFLGILGFEVEDQLETLPSSGLGEKIFGLVKASHSFSYDQPQGHQTVETDCLLGEPLYLLRELEGHLLVHSGEGYLGYVRETDVRRLDADAFARYVDGPSVRILENQQLMGGLLAPAGARLKWVRTTGDTVTAELPTGENVDIRSDACEVRQTPADEIDAVITNAKQLLGTSYLWGGKTSEGVDCSGLVQIGYATAGLHLPRDSYQQFYVGRLTATRWHTAGLRRGDTLYFLGDDGKIRHTGLYLGNDKFLHAVSPVVRVNSFNPEHDDYAPRQHKSFAFAKRLLD